MKNDLLQMNCDKEILNKKEINYMTYSTLIYLTNNNDYILEQDIIKNKKFIESLTNIKITTFIRNIRKLNNNLVKMDFTNKGEVVYKINRSDSYILIEPKILKTLINNTNNKMIKTYIFFKSELATGGQIINRKDIAKHIGYSTKSSKELEKLSKDIEDSLVKLGLIRKELVTLTSTTGNKYNKGCYYELVPYNEWIKYGGI